MRIIHGSLQGRKIIAPKNLPVRPTTDFAKEGLFNFLDNTINFENLKVLDLFSGTGNITYEFASRGAGEITNVDTNYHCVTFIRETIEKFGLKNIKVIKNDVFRFLGFCRESYDLIFADPPYDLIRIELIPRIVFEKNILNKGGLLVVEHSEQTDLSGSSHFIEKRTYGKVNFSIFS